MISNADIYSQPLNLGIMKTEIRDDTWQINSRLSSISPWNERSKFDPWRTDEDFEYISKHTSQDTTLGLGAKREVLQPHPQYVHSPPSRTTRPIDMKTKIELDDQFFMPLFEEETESPVNDSPGVPKYTCEKPSDTTPFGRLGSPFQLNGETVSERFEDKTLDPRAGLGFIHKLSEHGRTIKSGSKDRDEGLTSRLRAFKTDTGATPLSSDTQYQLPRSPVPQVVNHYHYHYHIYQRPVQQPGSERSWNPTPTIPMQPSLPPPSRTYGASRPYAFQPGSPPFVEFYQESPTIQALRQGKVPWSSTSYRYSSPATGFGYDMRNSNVSGLTQNSNLAFQYNSDHMVNRNPPHRITGNAFSNQESFSKSIPAQDHIDDNTRRFFVDNDVGVPYARGKSAVINQANVKLFDPTIRVPTSRMRKIRLPPADRVDRSEVSGGSSTDTTISPASTTSNPNSGTSGSE